MRIKTRANWGDRTYFDRPGWGNNEESAPVIAHGAYAYTGPLGCGKSILAVKHVHPYASGGPFVDPATGRCICGKKDCTARWRVYTNMPSTWKGNEIKPPGWAEPIDIAIQLTDSSAEIDHAVILIDEAHQVLEARRAMRNVNVDASYFTTHLRKRSCKLFFTTPSIDYVDGRLRDRTTRVFNTWTFNGGRSVHADVWNFAMGHLPPAMRNRQHPIHKSWYTDPAKNWYDSWERINNDDLFASREMVVLQKSKDGAIIRTKVEDIVMEQVIALANEGRPTVTPREVAEITSDRLGYDIAAGLVRRILLQAGYSSSYRQDSEPVFHIMFDMKEEVKV